MNKEHETPQSDSEFVKDLPGVRIRGDVSKRNIEYVLQHQTYMVDRFGPHRLGFIEHYPDKPWFVALFVKPEETVDNWQESIFFSFRGNYPEVNQALNFLNNYIYKYQDIVRGTDKLVIEAGQKSECYSYTLKVVPLAGEDNHVLASIYHYKVIDGDAEQVNAGILCAGSNQEIMTMQIQRRDGKKVSEDKFKILQELFEDRCHYMPEIFDNIS
jgi:hypothetical protein